jgi:hypothetical protein
LTAVGSNTQAWASVLEVTDELFFLGICTHDGQASGSEQGTLNGDVVELLIAFGVVR